MSISATVRQCLTKFTSIEGEHRGAPGLEDEHGRFRTWVGNISAHRSGGRRSLEYRLRDSSNLQSMVITLLEDLLKALDDLEIAMKVGIGAAPEDTHGISGHDQNRLEGSSDDEDDAALFGLTIADDYQNDASVRAIEEIHEVNLCLLRFSMTLRNPARHDQMKESASTSTHHFERFDIDHVQHKFPRAQPYLLERLGKAISKHRQYFKYREDHHSKLAEGLDDENVKDERPSTVATSLNLPAPETLTSKGDEVETESLYTATSYAPTTAGDVTLRPPPLPEAGQNGSPFECPLCFSIVIAEDERSWRQHVYEDLPPYVCTYAACITANQRYSRRRDWQRHQASSHNRYWLCPYGCSAQFDSEHVFQQHLNKQHHIDAQSAQQRLLETCVVAKTDIADPTCPLCQKQLSSSKLWMKHVGHHLEQLALHAVPQHVFTSDQEDNSGEPGQSARSSESSDARKESDIALDLEMDNNEGGEHDMRPIMNREEAKEAEVRRFFKQKGYNHDQITSMINRGKAKKWYEELRDDKGFVGNDLAVTEVHVPTRLEGIMEEELAEDPQVLGGNTVASEPHWVRALYDYHDDDPVCLSFRQGDIIQVISQLESGWWDGILHGVRAWFPSNYCVEVHPPYNPARG